jgi:hypothetical protein
MHNKTPFPRTKNQNIGRLIPRIRISELSGIASNRELAALARLENHKCGDTPHLITDHGHTRDRETTKKAESGFGWSSIPYGQWNNQEQTKLAVTISTVSQIIKNRLHGHHGIAFTSSWNWSSWA